MSIKWIKTAHKGLRYYEHATRKHGKRLDRYYAIRFRVDKILHEYGLGWVSDGIPTAILSKDPLIGFEEYCLTQMRLYKANIKDGSGVKSPKEKRQVIKEAELQEKIKQEKAAREEITFDDFFNNSYLPYARGNKKTCTVNREEGLYRLWIKNVIGFMKISAVVPLHLEAIKQNMAKADKSPRTVEYALVVVRQVFHYAHDRKIIHTIPFSFTKRNITRSDGLKQGKIVMPKPDNARMRYFKPDEINRLLSALKARSKDVHDMTILAFHAGLRFSEITALTWADVNLEEGFLTVRDAKTGSRFAYLTVEAVETLKSRKQGKPSDYVFQKRGKEGERVTSLSHLFYRTINELGFNDGIKDRRLRLCFHSARHTFGTVMYEETNDLYVTQKALGHATNIMTQRYAKMADHRLREATKALGNAYKKSTGALVVELKKG